MDELDECGGETPSGFLRPTIFASEKQLIGGGGNQVLRRKHKHICSWLDDLRLCNYTSDSPTGSNFQNQALSQLFLFMRILVFSTRGAFTGGTKG